MVGFPHGTALGLAHSQQRMTKQPTKQHQQQPFHCLSPTLIVWAHNLNCDCAHQPNAI
jgi:hypothetical protein